jgi:hypothetical protein
MAHRKGVAGQDALVRRGLDAEAGVGPQHLALDPDLACGVPGRALDPVAGVPGTTASKLRGAGEHLALFCFGADAAITQWQGLLVEHVGLARAGLSEGCGEGRGNNEGQSAGAQPRRLGA